MIVMAMFYSGFTNLVYYMCGMVRIKRCNPDWIIYKQQITN